VIQLKIWLKCGTNVGFDECKIKYFYYMTSSGSGQDEPNLALRLATRAGKMELSCPFGIRALSRKEN